MYFLNKERLNYKPKLPEILRNIDQLEGIKVPFPEKLSDDIKSHFLNTGNFPLIQFKKGGKSIGNPLKVGAVFSGGQAPGGHNVLAGIFDAIKKLHRDSQLIGFLDGPEGIIKNRNILLEEKEIDTVRNQGGFDLLGSGRTKIEKKEDFESVMKTCIDREIQGLVIIGGDDSNTNAALLSEFFIDKGCSTQVIGVPKTIDGDLKSAFIETSFGFDTAAKTFSTSIGSLLKDVLSAKKYTFFIKLMGRTASHITLECALETHPNLALISEEIAEEGLTLQEVVNKIADVICRRARVGKNYGAILIPEGLIEFIGEFKELISSLNELIKNKVSDVEAIDSLSKESKTLFLTLPPSIQQGLLEERDPHGNVQVSKIETERLFIELVSKELERRASEKKFHGKFSPLPIFLGYEGRSCLPSNFDAHYCYALGYTAALLIKNGCTAYMASIKKLSEPPEQWEVFGVPLASMMTLERRQGSLKPVIKKALVDLRAPAFQYLREHREKWIENDDYHTPGPIQFYGPLELTDQITLTLKLDSESNSFYL